MGGVVFRRLFDEMRTQSIPTHQADAAEDDSAGWGTDVDVGSAYPTSGSDLSKNDYNITLDFVPGGWK